MSLYHLPVFISGAAAIRLTDSGVAAPVKSALLSLEMLLKSIGCPSEVVEITCSCCSTGMLGMLVSLLLRRGMLRTLLSYRGWMYERKPSALTKFWGVLVAVLSGSKPSLYGAQSTLPGLHVPPLEETISKLLKSLEQIYEEDPKTMEELRSEAKTFLKGPGPKVQRALKLKSYLSNNYVNDWWEKYVYLSARDPLTINNNFYIMSECYWVPTTVPCARAANCLYQVLLVWEQILTGKFEPLMIRGTVPLCMNQYRRVMSSARIPGEEVDEIVHYTPAESQHIVVNRRGLMYRLEVVDTHGCLVCPTALEGQLAWIMQDADSRASDVPQSHRKIATLTAVDRSDWANTRGTYFCEGLNKDTLHVVESAILCVVLDENSFSEVNARAINLLVGQPGAYWFDKSLHLIVTSDGHFGINSEHSLNDGPVVGHVVEPVLIYDLVADFFDKDGHVKNPKLVKQTPSERLRDKPQLLQWDVSPKLEAKIEQACRQFEINNGHLDHLIIDHDAFGKGAIKKCKCSPDAFIQMALQTTYQKIHSRPALTYESSMTRLYKNGRTETVRSLTAEAKKFACAFLDKEECPQTKRDLLHAACERHAVNYKDSMNGKGVDRHIFGLYVASRGMELDCQFLKRVLTIPWTLSTSQGPQIQISWNKAFLDPRFARQSLAPGGGFGYVQDEAYGVCYLLSGEDHIFFHISSRKTTKSTDSAVFADTLVATLAEMRELFAMN